MSRDYGRVQTVFWNHKKVRGLTDDGRLMALYLLTNPHSNIIGAYLMPDAYMMDGLQWDIERVRKAFEELSAVSFAKHFRDGRHIVICDYLEWNAIENPKVAIGAVKQAEQLDRFDPAFEHVLKGLELHKKQFGDKWETVLDRLTQPSLKGLDRVSDTLSEGSTKPNRTPEPEPEPEPESESARAKSDPGWVPGQPVPDDWRVDAANARVGAQLPACDLNVEAARFSAYYAARDCSNITNWRQAFIAFVLRAEASATVQAPKQPPKAVERDRSWEMHPKTEAIIAAVSQAEFDAWLARCRIEEVSQAVLIHAPTALVRDRVWNLVPKLEPLFAGMHVGVMCLADPNVVPLAAAPSPERMQIPQFLRRKPEEAATA